MIRYFTKNYWIQWGRRYTALDFFDIVAFLVFIVGIAWAIRFFIFMPYTIEWESMAQTFENKDFIIVDKITPKFWKINRGDIVVFIPPGKDIPFIKRVIAFAGETVEIKNSETFICTGKEEMKKCTKLPDTYLSEGVSTEPRCGVSTFEIKEWFFLMGDNRWFSTDSRCCFGLGCTPDTPFTITQDRIIGKVLLRVFPHPTGYWNQSHLFPKIQ